MRFHSDCGPRWAGRRGRSFSFGPGGFTFDWGDGPGGWGGHRRRDRKRMFEGGELRLVLLKLIADEPRHGYELIKAVEELTEGEYSPSPGVVYPTLTMLEDIGFITERKSKDSKRVYEATDEGRTHLEEMPRRSRTDRTPRGQGETRRHGQSRRSNDRNNLMTAPATGLRTTQERAVARRSRRHPRPGGAADERAKKSKSED
jgi:DNA-binding PadR family transcriptional regulator